MKMRGGDVSYDDIITDYQTKERMDIVVSASVEYIRMD